MILADKNGNMMAVVILKEDGEGTHVRERGMTRKRIVRPTDTHQKLFDTVDQAEKWMLGK